MTSCYREMNTALAARLGTDDELLTGNALFVDGVGRSDVPRAEFVRLETGPNRCSV